ncbi:MAG: hypothetical protein IT305_04325 [Chloroflexi bacterium]|nr:hypothetical protein [Chloroflexota bacterium]
MRQISKSTLAGPCARPICVLVVALILVALAAPLTDASAAEVPVQPAVSSVLAAVPWGLAHTHGEVAGPALNTETPASLEGYLRVDRAPRAGQPAAPPSNSGSCYEPARPCGAPAVAPGYHLVAPAALSLGILWPRAAWAGGASASPAPVWAAVPTGPPR